MNWARVQQELRKMKFEDIYQRHTEKHITIEQAAELLGIHERTFRRWRASYEYEGAERSACSIDDWLRKLIIAPRWMKPWNY